MQRVTNKSFEEAQLSNCIKCGSDNILRTIKHSNRKLYDLFCYQCGHNVTTASVQLAIEKWNGTHVTSPSETVLMPCYLCEGEVYVKKENDKYNAICKECGKKERSRNTRWESVKLHNSNYKQMSTKRAMREERT